MIKQYLIRKEDGNGFMFKYKSWILVPPIALECVCVVNIYLQIWLL